MGRPRHSSYQSYQKLYARLLKGPLWIGDWKSTGLKSRSTVHTRLRHLASQGLVIRRREGHKILYEMAPLAKEGAITREALLWHKYLYPISRKERRRIQRQIRKHAKEIIEIEKQLTLGLKRMANIMGQIDKIVELPESQELLKFIPGWERIPIRNLLSFLLYPNLDKTLCLDCLERKGIIVYLVTDHETGEIICPHTGTVVRKEVLWI